MATLPGDDEPTQTVAQRVTRAVVVPVERNHTALLLALVAGAGSTAPFPFGIIVAAISVVVASGIARKR